MLLQFSAHTHTHTRTTVGRVDISLVAALRQISFCDTYITKQEKRQRKRQIETDIENQNKNKTCQRLLQQEDSSMRDGDRYPEMRQTVPSKCQSWIWKGFKIVQIAGLRRRFQVHSTISTAARSCRVVGVRPAREQSEHAQPQCQSITTGKQIITFPH